MIWKIRHCERTLDTAYIEDSAAMPIVARSQRFPEMPARLILWRVFSVNGLKVCVSDTGWLTTRVQNKLLS